MDKEFILKNIDEAIRLVTEQAETLLDLRAFRNKTDCGTIYCTAGLLACSAHFRALGWEWVGNFPQIEPEKYDDNLCESTVLDSQFGPDAFDALFCCRGGGPHDYPFKGSDKELALHRLRRQRQIVEAL